MDLWEKYHDQPCWHCTKSTGFCVWSSILKPVPGWKATPVFRNEPVFLNGTVVRRPALTSYRIHECPEFDEDRKAYAPPDKTGPKPRTQLPPPTDGGQYARAYYVITQRQSQTRNEEKKAGLRNKRDRIPWELVGAFIKKKKLTPPNAAMLLTGTLNPAALKKMRQAGYVSPVGKFYDRIAEAIGFDPYKGALNVVRQKPMIMKGYKSTNEVRKDEHQ